MDAVMHTHDRAIVPVYPETWVDQYPSPPIFGYTTTANFTDIPFPDFSYWGHEHGRIGGMLLPPMLSGSGSGPSPEPDRDLDPGPNFCCK